MTTAALRVTHVINNLPVGGAERFLVLLARAQRQQGMDVEVVTLTPPSTLAAELERHAVPWHGLGRTRLNDARLVWDLFRWLRRRRPDVLHTHLFYADVSGRIAGRCAGVPVIIGTEHSTEATRLSRRRRWLMRATAPLAPVLVAVSESVRDAMRERLAGRAPRIEVIPNGIVVQDWAAAPPIDRAACGIPATAVRVGCVGRLAAEKDHEIVLEAVARLADANVHLLLIGDGERRAALAAAAARHGIAAQVHFLGWREDVARWLRSLDVFAMPSRYEGHSMALLEAMAAGCACLVSDIPELRAQTDGSAWTAAAGDVDAWTRALRACIADPRARRERGAAAQRIAARSAIESSAAAYSELYARLLRASVGSAR